MKTRSDALPRVGAGLRAYGWYNDSKRNSQGRARGRQAPAPGGSDRVEEGSPPRQARSQRVCEGRKTLPSAIQNDHSTSDGHGRKNPGKGRRPLDAAEVSSPLISLRVSPVEGIAAHGPMTVICCFNEGESAAQRFGEVSPARSRDRARGRTTNEPAY